MTMKEKYNEDVDNICEFNVIYMVVLKNMTRSSLTRFLLSVPAFE